MRTGTLPILLLTTFFHFGAPADEPPRLTLMAGFLKDPEHPQAIEEWREGLGARFDARALVSRAKQAGVSEIIWYDKWHDGLLFHDTKTTSFHSEKDFLAELAPECRRQGVRLVVYFNAFADGNPEFEQWACRDQCGQPVGFGARWHCNHRSIFSPFRRKVLEQLREIVTVYDPDGVWLDAVRVPQVCYDRWSHEAFERQTGKTLEESTQQEMVAPVLSDHGIPSEAGYLTARLTNAGKLQQWESIPDGVRAVVLPDRASLTQAGMDCVRKFVESGGTAIAFGRGAGPGLDASRLEPHALFGATSIGKVQAPLNQGTAVSWDGKQGRLSSFWHVVPQSADVLFWTRTPHEGEAPVVTVAVIHPGQGSAYLVAAPESAVADALDVLAELLRLTIDEPVWATNAKRGDHIVRVFQNESRRYIHLLKRADTGDRRIRLRINPDVLPFSRATVVPDAYPLAVETGGQWNQVEVCPSPELLIAVE